MDHFGATTAAIPPTTVHPYTRRPLAFSTCQNQIVTYLSRAIDEPHLHPDSVLQSYGPTHSAAGGKAGGIIFHYLKRIEAGLRGEVLRPDPKVIVVEDGMVFGAEEPDRRQLPEGSDAKVDAMIEKQSGGDGGRKRKAGEMEELEMVEVEESPRKKYAEGTKVDTARAVSKKATRETENLEGMDVTVGGKVGGDVGVLDLDEYDRQQNEVVGDIGDRDHFVQSGGSVPTVQDTTMAGKSKADKEARKAAKKAKRTEDKKRKEAVRKQGKQ